MMKRPGIAVSFAWLLCLFMLVSALDRVPDPPVLSHHPPDTKTVCLSHSVQKSVDSNAKLYGSILADQLEPFWFTLRSISRAYSPGPRQAEVRQAADPSPPVLRSYSL